MSKKEKLFDRLRRSPLDCRYEELDAILRDHGGEEVNRRGAVRVWKLAGERFTVSIHDGSVDEHDVRDCVKRVLAVRDAVAKKALENKGEGSYEAQ